MSSAQPATVSTPGGFASVEKGETLIEVKNLKMYFPSSKASSSRRPSPT